MANSPGNPDYKNHKTSGSDTSIALSTTGGGASYWGTGESVQVTSNSNKVVSRADGALYDTVAGAYVSIQNTNVGTTTVPKNGQ